MSAVVYVIVFGGLALLFAFAAPADGNPTRPLYPTRDHRNGVVLALTAVVLAFVAGLSL